MDVAATRLDMNRASHALTHRQSPVVDRDPGGWRLQSAPAVAFLFGSGGLT
ncbi:Uncharacterized protein ToN1_02310 [Aromatoleum petrolei]|nr:Uncharacterized protein ToN1_02310 [Aromatoleum petrolei]